MPTCLAAGTTIDHHNSVVPSILHQVMKYANEQGRVRTLVAERHLFKGVENYFTDSLLYQDSLETDENLQPEELDSGNEPNTKREAEEECLWETNPLVTSINKLNFNTTANVEGEWFINTFLYLLLILYRQTLVLT